MSYQFFKNVTTPDEAKLQYIQLVKEYHPDKNPELSETECNNITAKINIEYKKVLNDLDNLQEAPEPTVTKPKKEKPHKSPVTDFSKPIKGKSQPKSRKQISISRKQAKNGIDWLFDGLELLKSFRK